METLNAYPGPVLTSIILFATDLHDIGYNLQLFAFKSVNAAQSFPGCNVKLANKEQVLRAGRALPAGPVPYITAHAAQKQADATDTKTSVKPISTTTSSRASSCAMKDFEASLCFPVGFPKPKWEMSLVAQWATDFDMGAK